MRKHIHFSLICFLVGVLAGIVMAVMLSRFVILAVIATGAALVVLLVSRYRLISRFQRSHNLRAGHPQSQFFTRHQQIRRIIRVLFGLGTGYGIAMILSVIVPRAAPEDWYLFLLTAAGAGMTIWRAVKASLDGRGWATVAWFLLSLLLLVMVLTAEIELAVRLGWTTF